ncbi:MAG: hypothetical protein V1707_00480 [bacterium]
MSFQVRLSSFKASWGWLSNVHWPLAAVVMSGVAAYAMHLVLAKYMAVGEFGDFETLWAIYSTLLVLPAGLSITATHFAADYKKNNPVKLRSFLNALKIVSLQTGLAIVATVIAVSLVAQHWFILGGPIVFTIMAFVVVTAGWVAILRAIAQGLGRWRLYAMVGVGDALVKVVIAYIVVGLKGLGTQELFFALLIENIIILPLLWQIVSNDLPKAEDVSVKCPRLWKHSGLATCSLVAITWLTSNDVFLARLAIPSDVGAYAVISLFGKAVLYISAAFGVVLYPMFSVAGPAEERWIARRGLLAVGALVLLGVVGTWLFGQQLLHYLYGDKFSLAASVMTEVAFFMGLLAVATVTASLYVARHVWWGVAAIATIAVLQLFLFIVPSAYHPTTIADFVSMLTITSIITVLLLIIGMRTLWQRTGVEQKVDLD